MEYFEPLVSLIFGKNYVRNGRVDKIGQGSHGREGQVIERVLFLPFVASPRHNSGSTHSLLLPGR